MKKAYLFVFLCFVSVCIISCGQKMAPSDSSSGSTTTTSSTTSTTIPAAQSSGKITGTAVVSETDLTKLGLTVTSQSISSLANVDPLVKGGVIRPFALTSGTAALCTMDASGNFVGTGVSTNLASDGTYTFNFTPEAGTLYYVKTTKENNGKSIILYAPAYMELLTSEVTAESSVTTTMVAKIVSLIVEELKNKNIDPQVIDVIKEYMFKVITDMINNGDIKVPSLVTTSGSENVELKKIVESLMDSASSKDMIKAMKLNLMMEKGKTSQAAATAFIREVFSIIAGGPDNIPSSAIDALGLAYYEGKTQTVQEIITAINGAGIDPQTGATTTLNLNADTMAASIDTSLRSLYDNISNKRGDVPPIILAVFPPAEKNSLLPVTKSSVFKVPQIMLVVQKLMDGHEVMFDPFKMMQNMGIYTMPSGLQIMHSEMRVVNYHDWGNGQGSGESDTPVISSFINLYSSQGVGALSGAQISLVYRKSDGQITSEPYVEESQMGGGKGMGKMYKIAPWGAPGEAKLISDFKKSLSGEVCTIIATVDGSTVTKDVSLVYIDLAGKAPDLQVPKATFDWSEITEIALGVQPVFSWVEPTNVTLPSGYVLKYALDVSIPSNDQFGPPTQLYNSWNRQEFISGKTFALPVALVGSLEAGHQYFVGLRALAVEEATNKPVAEGPFVGGLFIVKNAADMKATNESYSLSGTITSTANDTALKVGLFKVNQTVFTTGSKIEPVKLGTISGSNFTIDWKPGTLVDYKGFGIEVIAWNDADGDGKILVGGPTTYGEPMSFARKHIGYWGGTLSVWDENLQKDAPLKDSLTTFDCDLTFGGHRTFSLNMNMFGYKDNVIKMLSMPAVPIPENK